MKTRIFVSAVSREFKTARDKVAHVLEFLGYEVEMQEIFGTEPGDLREMLRSKIDSCQGLIQIVGKGYGAEPPSIDSEYGRVSYTQFEFCYAQKQKKQTWVLMAGEDCGRDCPADALDLPAVADHPDPLKYQSERQDLQSAYARQFQQGQHVWWPFTSDVELENAVLKVRNDSEQLRKEFRGWQEQVTSGLLGLEQKLVAARGSHRRSLVAATAIVLLAITAAIIAMGWFSARNASKVEGQLRALYEAQKELDASLAQAAQGSNNASRWDALARKTGLSEEQIHHTIQEAAGSDDVVLRAMAQYLAGDYAKVFQSTGHAISQTSQQVVAPLAQLADLHTLRGLAHFKSKDKKPALEEFKKAWSAYATLGNADEELQTRFLAAAILFCDFGAPIDGAEILADTLSPRVPETVRYDALDFFMLFASPGVFLQEAREAGWLNDQKLAGEETITVMKQVAISSGPQTGSTVVSLPVGFSTFTVEKARAIPPLIELAATVIPRSKYFGEQHPYVMLLYLNHAETCLATGNIAMARELAAKLAGLARFHQSNPATLPTARSIVLSTGGRAIIAQLEKGGYAEKSSIKLGL